MNDDTVFRPCREAASIDEALIPKDAALAMAYEALSRGTAFRSLVKPFWAMEVER